MKAAWLLSPLALLVFTSADMAQATSGKSNNQANRGANQNSQVNQNNQANQNQAVQGNAQTGLNNSIVAGNAGTNAQGNLAQGSFGGGFPLKPVDGVYVILAYERNGIPATGVVNRNVTIRNNIMSINTGDANAPAKSFVLRFLPNNQIRLIEVDPRLVANGTITGNMTGATGGTGGAMTGAGQVGGNTAPGNPTPPFNPRPDLGGTPPAGSGQAPGKTRLPTTPPFNPRPDLGGTPPGGTTGTGTNQGTTGNSQLPNNPTPPFNPRPDLGGTPPDGTFDDNIPNRLGVEMGVYVQSTEIFAISVFARNAGGGAVNAGGNLNANTGNGIPGVSGPVGNAGTNATNNQGTFGLFNQGGVEFKMATIVLRRVG